MKYPGFKEMILFEDDDVIIINKPPWLSTLADRGNATYSALELGKKYNPDVQVCHRLDKQTSGTLILSKKNDVYIDICKQFYERKVTKVYHAIVNGNHDFHNLCVEHAIIVKPKPPVKIDNKYGKISKTIFSSIHYYNSFTLVECLAITGRMHQIRIHLSSQSAPIAADVMYGGKFPYLSEIKRKYKKKPANVETPLIKRAALHAYQIRFKVKGREIAATAPYADDFAVFLKRLDKYDSSETQTHYTY